MLVPFQARRGQTTPQMFHDFLGILHYFALLRKYWLFLHQTWQMSRRQLANFFCMKNVSKCQMSDVTMMTSCFSPRLKFLICITFIMCSKEHIKRSWNVKKFCRYHENWMRYGIFNFEKYLCKLWGPPLEKNSLFQLVILFEQIQLCCICDLADDHSKNKRRKWE